MLKGLLCAGRRRSEEEGEGEGEEGEEEVGWLVGWLLLMIGNGKFNEKEEDWAW
jgi:hypothetical protein